MESHDLAVADAPATGATVSEDSILEALPVDTPDPVVAALDKAREQYHQVRGSWEGKLLDLEESQARLTAEAEQLRAHLSRAAAR